MTEHAKSNAAAWLATIEEMITALDAPDIDTKAEEDIHQRIYEGPLSVQFRAGWFDYGKQLDGEVEEFSILLSTGGPALRIHGQLTNAGNWDVDLEYQDWGTPWTRYPTNGHEQAALERYASFHND